MKINNSKFPIVGHDLLCFRYNDSIYGIKRELARCVKKALKDAEKEDNYDYTYTALLHKEQITFFDSLCNNNFIVESDIPHPKPVFDDLYIPELYSQIIDILSDVVLLNKKIILLSKNTQVQIKNGSKVVTENAKIRYVFPIKLVIKIILIELFFKKSIKRKNQIINFDILFNDPIKFLPYYFSFFFNKIIDSINLPDNYQENRKFYFFNEVSKKLDFSQPIYIEKKLSKNELEDAIAKDSSSMETNVFIEYIKKDNTLNIVFEDELIIDSWLGSDSIFFTAENLVFFLVQIVTEKKDFIKFISKEKKHSTNDSNKIYYRLMSQYYNVLSGLSDVNSQHNKKKSTDEFDDFVKTILKDNIYYSNSTIVRNSEKYTSSLDFIYSSKMNNAITSLMNDIHFDNFRKNLTKLKNKNKTILLSPKGTDVYNNCKIKQVMSSIGKQAHKRMDFIPVLDKVFCFTRDIKKIEKITCIGSRPLLFAFLGIIHFELVKLQDYQFPIMAYSLPIISEYMQSFKMNIVHLDKINLEQRKREEDAKLLVRNLRHSINNTSEAVLANLKEAIEIINQQNACKSSVTANHLYSCSDEVRVLRNTVLKFCHEIIDTDTLAELYRESFAEVKAEERLGFKEILYSSLFMAVKQIIQNIRLKDLKNKYRQAKAVELQYKGDLFNKFKEYIGIKYDQDFSELTESEMKEDKTLSKDYQNYVYTAIQSSDFNVLYEDFIHKNNFTAVPFFMEKYFFSKIEVNLNNDEVYFRRASYASYLFTDLLNEIYLNVIKYTEPNSKVKIEIEVSNSRVKAEFTNKVNLDLKQKYGSGMGIIGQQKVVEKVGGNLQTHKNKSGEFSLKFELPIY